MVAFAPHHVTNPIIHPTPDILVGGVWALTVLASFPVIITVITGILAGIYYGLGIYDNLAKKFKKEVTVTNKTQKSFFFIEED